MSKIEAVHRDIKMVVCSCGGLVEEVPTTPEENKKFGCHITNCCVRAWQCPSCKTRFTVALEAPDTD